MIQWIQDNLAIPLFMGAGAIGMKIIDKILNRRKANKDLTAQDINNTKGNIENFEKLNNLLLKQLETNTQRYLDIMNINISLKGDNVALRAQLQELTVEVRKLKQACKEYEIEISKLKKYIVNNNIKVK